MLLLRGLRFLIKFRNFNMLTPKEKKGIPFSSTPRAQQPTVGGCWSSRRAPLPHSSPSKCTQRIPILWIYPWLLTIACSLPRIHYRFSPSATFYLEWEKTCKFNFILSSSPIIISGRTISRKEKRKWTRTLGSLERSWWNTRGLRTPISLLISIDLSSWLPRRAWNLRRWRTNEFYPELVFCIKFSND